MWACDRITAVSSSALNGRSRFLSCVSARRPWNMPKSSATADPPTRTRWQEPVTSRAAPWKVTFMPVDDSDGSAAAANHSHRELRQLANPQHRAGGQRASRPIGPAQCRGAERVLHGRYVQYDRLQSEREDDGGPDPCVREEPRECAAFVGARIEHVEQLRENQGVERHRLCVLEGATSLHQPA